MAAVAVRPRRGPSSEATEKVWWWSVVLESSRSRMPLCESSLFGARNVPEHGIGVIVLHPIQRGQDGYGGVKEGDGAPIGRRGFGPWCMGI